MGAAETASELIRTLLGRTLPEGGFAPQSSSPEFRPDSSAWAVISLECAGAEAAGAIPASRRRLEAAQQPDGSIPMASDQPVSFWPTALALMAWCGAAEFEAASGRAVEFLFRTTGLHYRKPDTSPMGHDTSLRGWPWAAGTHSWVEPTALALLALRAVGRADHPRYGEAVRMLQDRQLPRGGWNYGNTIVFGAELLPLPYATGIALSALAGEAQPGTVTASISYLQATLQGIRTPVSLSWGILGLSAWGARPRAAEEWVQESLERQMPESPYSTSNLALLLCALSAREGLAAALDRVTGRVALR